MTELPTTKRMIHELGEALYGLSGLDWVITTSHTITEPVCPVASIYPESFRSGRYDAWADTMEEAIRASVSMAYREWILKETIKPMSPLTTFDCPIEALLKKGKDAIPELHKIEYANNERTEMGRLQNEYDKVKDELNTLKYNIIHDLLRLLQKPMMLIPWKHWHHADLKVRINGEDRWFEADYWIRPLGKWLDENFNWRRRRGTFHFFDDKTAPEDPMDESDPFLNSSTVKHETMTREAGPAVLETSGRPVGVAEGQESKE